jgi:NADH-quinone oxidoreductase subunit K
MNLIGVENYLVLATAIFFIGLLGVLLKRNILIIMMCIELMLNACNLAFITFAKSFGVQTGQMFVFFSMLVAAAEVAVGLSLVVYFYKRFGTLDIHKISNRNK